MYYKIQTGRLFDIPAHKNFKTIFLSLYAFTYFWNTGKKWAIGYFSHWMQVYMILFKAWIAKGETMGKTGKLGTTYTKYRTGI